MNKIAQIGFMWRTIFMLLRRAAPVISSFVFIITILEAFVSIAVLYVLKLLVDTISTELSPQASNSTSGIIQILMLTGGVILFSVFFQSLARILRMRQGLLVRDHVDKEIHDRAISVGLKFYESPAYFDALSQARSGGTNRPAQVVANAITSVRGVIILIAIFVLLANIEYSLLPVLAIPIILALLIRLYFTRRLFNWRMSRTQKERRAYYLDSLMTQEYHAKDLRLNRIGSFLRDQYRAIRLSLREDEINIEQKRLLTEFGISTIGAIVFIGASAWLLQDSLQNGRPIGDVVLFVLLLRRAEGAGSEFINSASRIVDDHLYLHRLIDYLNVKPEIAVLDSPKAIPQQIKAGIELSNVSFKYVDADEYALRDVSLTLKPGQIVALVGANGSGKTTLIKILTRLYDPTNGIVSLDGIDVRQFNPDDYRRLLSVVFQDFALYAETVRDNIHFGDVNLHFDENRAVTAAKFAGADEFISKLPNGYDTKLTKMFDGGHDLSIGQWQRLALARALYPKSKFLILDEPTSAMDPKAEFDLFENFRSRIRGRGALIISHRLSTIREADYIYVLADGKIAEKGTHEELIAVEGRYARLFEKQASHYK
ncbi:MAG: ABC transporter ATP-binding protein [Pseudomonadota bacterium]